MSTNPMRQSPSERAVLKAAWEALPEVVDAHKRIEAVIVAEGLRFDAAGITRANEVLASLPRLPESGIFVG